MRRRRSCGGERADASTALDAPWWHSPPKAGRLPRVEVRAGRNEREIWCQHDKREPFLRSQAGASSEHRQRRSDLGCDRVDLGRCEDLDWCSLRLGVRHLAGDVLADVAALDGLGERLTERLDDGTTQGLQSGTIDPSLAGHLTELIQGPRGPTVQRSTATPPRRLPPRWEAILNLFRTGLGRGSGS